MAAIPPAHLLVDRQALTVLQRVMAAARPAEGCALLLGSTGLSWRLQLVWPCLNCWPEPGERGMRFALDPREQLLAQRWARQRGLQVLGCAHSHPRSAAVPSATDLALTLAPTLLLIEGQDLQWRGWWHGADAAEPWELALSSPENERPPQQRDPAAGG